jgi:uncharacterized protein (TIGR03083 family)
VTGEERSITSAEDLREHVVAQRAAFADVLQGLTADQWNAPSLCEGWRVRELVAHVSMPFRYSTRQVIGAVLRARGRFDVASDRLARRDAGRLSVPQLIAAVRDNVDHPWTPPGGGRLGALSHDLIHSLDVTEALGLDSATTPERVRLVLGNPKLAGAFKVDLAGHCLAATDVEGLRVGQGAEVAMPAKDVLLVLTDRRPVPTSL